MCFMEWDMHTTPLIHTGPQKGTKMKGEGQMQLSETIRPIVN